MGIANSTLETPLPSRPDIEKAVLGSILLNGDIQIALDVLSPHCFSSDVHRQIWMTMTELHAAGSAIDRLTVFTRAKDMKRGAVTLGTLIDMDDNLPQILNIGDYVRILRDVGTRREAIIGLGGIAEKLADTSLDAEALLSNATHFIESIETNSQKAQGLTSGRGVIERAGGLEAYLAPDNVPPTIPTPWRSVNDRFLGFSPGKLYLIAARPSVGKTAFALQCAWHAATTGDHPMFISLEMESTDLVNRVLSCQAHVMMGRIHYRKFNREDLQALSRTASSEEMSRIRFTDTYSITIPKLRQIIIQADPKPEVVFVDYLQLMTPVGGQNRNDEVSIISRGLKLLAKEMGVAMVALSQLRRPGPDQKEATPPTLSSLRDSGSLEQDADFVGFLHRGAPPMENSPVEVSFIIAKQRSGSLGRTMLTFDGTYQRFLGDGDAIPSPPTSIQEAMFDEEL